MLYVAEFDFPQINYKRCNGRDYQYVYGTGSNSVNGQIDCVSITFSIALLLF